MEICGQSFFQLIDERSGVTDFTKVKSHLEDAGLSVIKQNKIAFHHMLANSLADVVAEEAAKRLLPDLNLERKAKWAERVGLGWRNDWLWCKRTFGPREVKLGISTNSTLWWWKKQHARGLFSARWWTSWPTKAIYLYVTTKVCVAKYAICTEAYKQFGFWSSHPAKRPPRSSPDSKTRKDSSSTRQQENSCHVLDQSGARNKTLSKHDEKELLHCTSLCYRDVQCTHQSPRTLPSACFS